MIFSFIACRPKLLNADWLRQRAFFLNQEGTFGNQEGMITWCWLAEHACIKLVSHFKQILKRNFRNASLLSLILTRSFHLNMEKKSTRNKAQSFSWKAKGCFRPKTSVLIRSLKTVWVWTASVERSTRQNFVASKLKLKVNFFVSLQVALLVLQA